MAPPYSIGVVKFSLILSALGLLSAALLFTYLEVSPQFPSPIDALKTFVFPSEPTSDSMVVDAPPILDFSEANILLAWAALTGITACFSLWKVMRARVTDETAQPRAIAVISSLLAIMWLLVLTPLLLSVCQVAYG